MDVPGPRHRHGNGEIDLCFTTRGDARFDGQPEGKQAIKDGKIYADPIQFPEKMGVEVVRAFIRHSKGEELPPQMLIPTSLYRQSDGEADASLK